MFFAQSVLEMPTLEKLLSMSGLEFMQSMLAGEISQPPMCALLNQHLSKVEKGSVTFTATPKFEVSNPIGSLHGGWYGAVLDSALGCSVMTTLARGTTYTTAEYKVNIIRAIPIGCPVVVKGVVDHTGRTTSVAHADIRGLDDDRLYATGTTTCVILRPDV